MRSKVAIYTIHQYMSDDFRAKGTRCSLRPWPGNAWNDVGEDDGGADYILPEGYEVADIDGGERVVWDAQGRYCPIVLGEDDAPVLVTMDGIIKMEKEKVN